MERLTVKTPKGAALKMDDAYPSENVAREDLMEKFRAAVECLAAYEDTGLTPEEVAALAAPNDPLTLEELREMDGEPVWIAKMDGSGGVWMLVDAGYELCREAHGELAVFENCGKTWLAYRRRPEEGTL